MFKKLFLLVVLSFLILFKGYSLGFPSKLYPNKVLKKVGYQILKKVHK
jgi:hypothetical protein